jgi:hypothetical protein
MDLKMIRRASALAILAFLLSATAVFADTIPADGDVIAGNQGNVDLGSKEPGELITRTVNFSLVCSGSSHAIAGQTATIQPSSYGKPLDGTIVSTSTTIGPVPSTWPVAPATCGSTAPILNNGSVTVTLRAPTTPGIDYQFTIIYARLGISGLTGSTVITYTVDVEANTPPTLTLPARITAEATSPAGAVVSYTVSASDARDDPDPTPSCVPASGSQFALGTTGVACTVTDSGGLTTTGSFNVVVNDTVAPSLALPGTITAEATSAAGADVFYTVTATDVADPVPAIGCSPLSGSTFALGTTSVDCTAVDASGNVSSGSFDVAVSDTTAPGLLLPGALAAEATSAAGADVSYTVTATDVADPAPTVACAPASGSTFPLGTTNVNCTSTDASGNAAAGSFDVIVGDSAAPVLSGMPGDISVTTTNAGGRSVTWASPSATDTVGGTVPVTCAPQADSTFAIGATTVTCTATDGAGNSASATFSVTVTLEDTPPAPPPYTVTWGEPISGGTLEANQSRTVPLKIRLFLEGVELTTGTAVLTAVPCSGGDPVLTAPLTFNGGRWQGHLDTGQVNPGCYTVTAMVDGHSAGSFALDLTGAEPTSSPKPRNDKPKK